MIYEPILPTPQRNVVIFNKIAVKEAEQQLIKSILTYIHSQRALWRRIPYLATLHQGRTGYNDHIAILQYTGYWIPVDNPYTWMIDCQTGRLCRSTTGRICHYVTQQSPWYNHVAELRNARIDARVIVRDLVKGINAPLPSYARPEDELRAEQQMILQRNGIDPVFTRRVDKLTAWRPVKYTKPKPIPARESTLDHDWGGCRGCG